MSQSMRDLFFSIPWWVPAGLAVVGIVLFRTGNRRVERRTVSVGLVSLLLATALALVSYYGQTDLEKAQARTRQLFDAADGRNWPAVRLLLDPGTRFESYRNRDEIASAASTAAARYGLKAVHVLSVDARQAGAQMTVSVDAITEQDVTLGQPLSSAWQFEWVQTKDGVVLRTITLLRLGQAGAEEVRRHLP